MQLPSWIFRQERIGKNGRPFTLYKIRTMIPNPNVQFATHEVYTKWGRFLRKTKIDELPQLLNVLKGDMAIFGPRPDVQEVWDVTPQHIKNKILSVKPGLLSVANLYFHDEESMLEGVEDKYKNYYTIIKPMKFHLDTFWIEHRCFILNLALIWMTFKVLVKKLFKR